MDKILASPGATLEILDRFGIRARKKYGQNFLIDANIVRGIIETAGITQEDCVLEIGPGIGTMTQLLSAAAGRVVSVEIDESLQPVLEQTLSDCPNVTILWQDVLKTDLVQVRDEYAPGKRMKVVANLPYYVTTPILMQLLEQKDLFESITVMVQKEVADRICSGPGSKEYGAISLAVQYYAQPEAAIRVAPSCFIPHPNVDSTVLYLRAYEKPPVEADESLMFALIRAAFNQRRKTLANAVSHGLQAPFGPFTREQVAEALKTMNLPETVRGEALSLEQYAALSKYLGYDTLNPV
ncbi:MAG: 16S rRNA (adenine(1518)-N(6)/adenine(1519)-N(6))-dimethyltransferase RsmA [Lachnospiraceae bacterium]|nr:16S rRNA (adenine(1518)-N(6)/adenine(1519)-N(6))-dimethyltransferase RsmA [Lachnospiraceae bacterium]